MTRPPQPSEQKSLLAYLRDYAAGRIDHEQMLDTVAAWPLTDTHATDGDPGDYLPGLDDNSAAVLSAAVTTFGWITDNDYAQIARRRKAASPGAGFSSTP